MHESSASDSLQRARRSFQQRPDNVEPGLETDDPTILQIRKACRLLSACDVLLAEYDYYTVIIESSFGAIERTLQFYLQRADALSPQREYIGHELIYERAAEVGLYDREFENDLLDLWTTYRSGVYYRERKATRPQAKAMFELADEIHRFVLDYRGERHFCLCSDSPNNTP